MSDWRYYNHAMLPSTAPHKLPNLSPLNDGSIWKSSRGGTPLFARWTTDFDCGYETNWWYIIKDTPFDIGALKAKRRYEINKGKKNFYVEEIKPEEWAESIYAVAVAAYSTYPESYRPNISHDQFISDVMNWDFYKVYGAYSLENKSLCGYACLNRKNLDGCCINFTIMKAMPDKEKLGLNAVMVNKILVDHEGFLNSGGYICDGSRSINHETSFQDYLEKYFGFRKAYCHLHVQYNPKIEWLIKLLFPIRNIFDSFDRIAIFHSINSVLKMEEICRSDP